MRYSIIHHDVKEEFGLTVSEYLVCDSIHQLSARGSYKGTWVAIADFLGTSTKTLSRSVDTLTEKGLLEQHEGGTRTSEKWFQAVTQAGKKQDKMSGPTGQNVPSTGQNVPFSPLYKEYKEDITVVAPLRVEKDPPESRKLKGDTRKYPNARMVFSWFPKQQPFWNTHSTELKHAEMLFTDPTRGEVEVKKRLRYLREHAGEEFLPQIDSPYDLNTKWEKLSAYAKRNS